MFGRVARAATVVLALSLLTPPVAAGARATGLFLLDSTFQVEGLEHVELTPLALLLRDGNGLESLALTQAHGVVCVHERRVVETEVAGQAVKTHLPPQQDCTERTSLVVHAYKGQTGGWLGIYPNGSSTVGLEHPFVNFTVRDDSLLASEGAGDASTDGAHPNASWYAKKVAQEHLLTASPGKLTFVGNGLLKLTGPRVHLTSAEGTAEYRTGYETTGTGTGRESTLRWVSLYLADAEIKFHTSTPVAIAAAKGSPMVWDGALHFTPKDGALVAGLAKYQASGTQSTLVGRFEAIVEPADGGQVRMTLDGELRSTSLKAQPRTVSPSGSDMGATWIILVAATVLAMGGGAAILALKRSQKGQKEAGRSDDAPDDVLQSTDVEQLLKAARQAAPRNPASAEQFFEAALKLDPTNRLAWLDLAYVRFHQGKLTAALLACDRAGSTAPEDEADALAAACLVGLGEQEKGEARLARALRAKELSFDVAALVNAQPELQALIRSSPGLEILWREATDRLFRGWKQ